MFAVVFTLLLSLYILGPDQVSRFVLGFSVPRRAVSLTRSEEVARAVLWSGGALCLALLWAEYLGPLGKFWDKSELAICFGGIYSEQFYRDHQAAWQHSVKLFLLLNYCLLWRLYTIVLAVSFTFNFVIRNYAQIRHFWRVNPRRRKYLALLVLPRIAPWHLLLSRFLLHERNLHIHVDVLTKSGILYQGLLTDNFVDPSGSLVSVTLEEPRRFKREQYLEDTKEQKSRNSGKGKATAISVSKTKQRGISIAAAQESELPRVEAYWKPIPTNVFVIMATDICSLNLRYVPKNISALKENAGSQDLAEVLSELAKALKMVNQAKKI